MRTYLITALTVVAALAAPAASLAAQADGGTPQSGRTAVPGAGKATSAATADASGAMSVSSSATGGRSLLPLALPGFGPSAASGVASVSRSFAVQAGTYRVTVTQSGASQTRSSSGAGAADVIRLASAQFVDGDEEKVDGQPVIRFERNDLPSSPGTVSSTLEVTVPAGESGTIFVRGGLTAQSSAPRQGDTGSVSAQAGRTSFEVGSSTP